MNQISLNLDKFKLPKKPASQETEAHFERSYWIDQVRTLVKRPYIQMLKLTEHLETREIQEMYLKACSFKKNSPALMWKLLGESKK